MKRIVLVFLLIIGLTACSSNDMNAGKSTNDLQNNASDEAAQIVESNENKTLDTIGNINIEIVGEAEVTEVF